MIRKLGSGEYRLYSRRKNPETGKRRVLGTFPSLEEARDHKHAIERARWRFWKLVEAALVGLFVLGMLSFAIYMLLRSDLSANSPTVGDEHRILEGYGWFSAGIALLFGALLAYQSSHGYVYCGRTETVRKTAEPLLFWVWFSINLGLVLAMAAISFGSFLHAF